MQPVEVDNGLLAAHVAYQITRGFTQGAAHPGLAEPEILNQERGYLWLGDVGMVGFEMWK